MKYTDSARRPLAAFKGPTSMGREGEKGTGLGGPPALLIQYNTIQYSFIIS